VVLGIYEWVRTLPGHRLEYSGLRRRREIQVRSSRAADRRDVAALGARDYHRTLVEASRPSVAPAPAIPRRTSRETKLGVRAPKMRCRFKDELPSAEADVTQRLRRLKDFAIVFGSNCGQHSKLHHLPRRVSCPPRVALPPKARGFAGVAMVRQTYQSPRAVIPPEVLSRAR
jgi:hypothetical protein